MLDHIRDRGDGTSWLANALNYSWRAQGFRITKCSTFLPMPMSISSLAVVDGNATVISACPMCVGKRSELVNFISEFVKQFFFSFRSNFRLIVFLILFYGTT